MRTALLILLAPLALVGCITETDAEPAPRPDGGDQCLATPTCPPDSEPVEICPDDAVCHEETLCGATILCAAPAANCLAYPSCPEGSVEVDACAGDAICEPQSLCGHTILCAQSANNCAAYPVCPDGTVEVDECPAGAACEAASVCGYTILCAELGPACDGPPPTCPAHTVQVDACDPAHPDCTRVVDECRQVAHCVPDEQCLAEPTCPAGSLPVPACPDGSECEQVIECGRALLCELGVDPQPVGCAAVATCPAETREVAYCPAAHPDCLVEEVCVTVAYCVPDFDCDAEPTCPEGFEPTDRCAASPDTECAWIVECGDALLCQGPRG